MKTFYSILYSVIQPETDEKIAIGFLLSDDSSCIFGHSKRKLFAAKPLLEDHEYKFIKKYIASVIKIVAVSGKTQYLCKNFGITENNSEIINESYLSYLSIYSKNVVWFSKPLPIDVEVNQQNFNILFRKLIDNKFRKVTPYPEKET